MYGRETNCSMRELMLGCGAGKEIYEGLGKILHSKGLVESSVPKRPSEVMGVPNDYSVFSEGKDGKL
jgi:hypothetical protein